MSAPTTAAARTRMVRKAIIDAGYTATVRSAPVFTLTSPDASGRRRTGLTTVHFCKQCTDADAMTAYLSGYLNDVATVEPFEHFLSVSWS